MTLAAYVAKRRPVSLGQDNAPLLVRGISLDDITAILGSNLVEVDKIFKMYERPEMRDSAIQESLKTAVTIVKDAPNMVGVLIARCCDEPDLAEIARTLPIDIQIDAIQQIVELSFEESGGAKKFFDKMLVLVKTVRPQARGERA